MGNDLLRLTFQNWEAVLFSFIPALVNLFILIYVFFFNSISKTTGIFALFVFALFTWQMNETMIRLSATAETAALWNSLLSGGTNFITAFGLHFTLIHIQKRSLANSPLLLFILYVPFVIFFLVNASGMNIVKFTPHPFWAWQINIEVNILSQLKAIWISTTAILMFILLMIYALNSRRKNSPIAKQAFLIAIGFSIPTIQGTITQVIFPLFTELETIPIASTSMTCFSVCTIIAIRKYQLFYYSPIQISNTIFENMCEGIVIEDINGVMRYVNNKFCEISGYSRKDLIGETTYKLLFDTKENREFVLSKIEKRKQFISDSYEIKMRHKSGKVIWMLVSGSYIKDRRGNVTGSVGISTDISKRKEIEQKLIDKNKELEMFIYKASHDLRGAVCSTKGLVDAAKSEVRDSLSLSFFNLISKTNEGQEKILEDLTQVTFIQQGEVKYELIDFKALVNNVILNFEHYSNFNTVKFIIKNNLESDFYSDAKLLRTIMHNIIENAIKYGRKNITEPFIDVSIDRSLSCITIVIADNGIGIPLEHQHKVFDMFSKANLHSKGSGLGLYIVKYAVEKLNGKIEMESEENRGSTFKILFPDAYLDK